MTDRNKIYKCNGDVLKCTNKWRSVGHVHTSVQGLNGFEFLQNQSISSSDEKWRDQNTVVESSNRINTS